MQKIISSIDQRVGHTPLVKLGQLSADAAILAKLEGCNPTGSVKDRAALAMLLDGENRGLLTPGSVVIEPTSGNTGIALAALGAARGYRVILVMPETMSPERRALLKAYGAELILTQGKLGMQGAVDQAAALAAEIPGSFIPGQFTNPANPQAHYTSTGPEIWEDSGGNVDIFVAGVGTGGTLTGTGRYLKERNPNVRIVAVEPASSPLLSKGTAGPHGLQGIGANFLPEILDTSIIDEILPVTEQEAYAAARTLARQEGILAGISSGAALHAATELAGQVENRGKTIAVILPDTGERYLSTGLFAE